MYRGGSLKNKKNVPDAATYVAENIFYIYAWGGANHSELFWALYELYFL